METSKAPAYTVIVGGIEPEKLYLTVCLLDSTTQFHIDVLDEDMSGTTFEKLRTENKPVHFKCAAWEKLCGQLIPTCIPQFKHIEQSLLCTTPNIHTIYSYYRAPHFSLKIVACGIGHTAKYRSGPTYAPRAYLEPIPIDTLSLLPGLPYLEAQEIYIIPEDSSPYALPSKVQDIDGKVQFFKPCIYARELDFKREVSLLCQIRKLGLDQELRVSKILGVVIVSEDKKAIGVLLEWIPGCVLADTARTCDWGQSNKWRMQIEHIVERLHSYDIVWGDVNPYNILISENDAYAIDFGGSCNVAFIDETNMETIDGDWQGVRKVFNEWLPTHGKED